MKRERLPHIFHASSNLLGICFVLITGLKLTGASDHTFADELCLISAVGFMSACVLSYFSLRTLKNSDRIEIVADYIFIVSMISLFIAVLAFARDLF